jgi:hypothetical protein
VKDPLSLRGDPSMSLALRRDLDRYARHGTVPYDADRGLERLAASLALTSAAGGMTAKATGAKAAAKALSWPGFNVLAVSFGIGAVAIAGSMAMVHGSHTKPPPAVPGLVAPIASPALVAPAPEESPLEVDSAAPQPSDLPARENRAPAGREPRAVRKTPPAAAPAPADPPEAPRGRSVREAIEALAHLREVASRDPAAAADLATEDEARYGSDLFAEEREAIALVALANCGRMDEARARGRVFLALHPKSAFAARVQEALGP